MDELPLISAVELSRFYGHFCAVDALSFEVKRGQVVGFLGTNGAGKTTTMQMLTGNLAPTSGQIRLAGFDLLDSPLAAKSQLGYLPEHPPLYPECRVDEYLRFCARLHGLSKTETHQAVDEVLNTCGLTGVYRRLIANLSKGYQQRVGIAQAIVHSPSVVVLDEPTVGLDPVQSHSVRELIQKLGQQRAVIVSTHLLNEVQSICTHVQILQAGRCVLQGALRDLLHQPVTTLTLGLHHAPSLARLKILPNVQQVESITPNKWRLHCSPGQLPTDAIVQAAAAERWGLFELTPEYRTLEQLFIELTQLS
ncbi:ABC transporter ATP-binding protein [Thioflexithrix psekupsensis]|uniref:ABC transporter ATP-binding protein n=1 Tax=Thioflexithrix psekupsensis TaxID=1570016 RepID=A0A251XAA8_9GAMM|nr:ATP-binding cassette domain-containing protein [Thioflexithrix psekupsensis]OUD14968.1 ABC transporter ATP-binding protein [Thioflexithrix psekupsensis]